MSVTATIADGSKVAGTFEDLVANEVTDALHATGYNQLRYLEVVVDGHEVWLRGRVPSYFLKQKAEFITLSIPDVGIFHSEIEVAPAA